MKNSVTLTFLMLMSILSDLTDVCGLFGKMHITE